MKVPTEAWPAQPLARTASGTFAGFTSGMGRAVCLLVTGMMVWSGLTNPLGHRVLAVAAILLAAAALLWWFALRRPATPQGEAAWRRAGTATLVLLCAASFAWALAFDSNQSSDFGIYYRCGTHLQEQLYPWMESCRSHYFYQPDYTYWSRALVYSAPFGLLFGDNYPLFKLYNAGLHAATMALLYFGVRNLAGARAACVALLLLAVYPEWFFSVTVATPDNIAVLFLVGFLLLLPAVFREQGVRGWLAVALLAVLALLAHLARTIGLFLMVALALATLVNLRPGAWKQPLLRAAAVIVLYNLANAGLVAYVGKPIQGQFAFVERLSTVDLHAPLQNYRLVFAWVDQFLPVLPDTARGQVAIRRIVTEMAQGFPAYPGYLLAKTRVFAEGVGYYLYSSTDAGANPDSAITAPAFTVPTRPAMLFLLAGVVMFVAAVAFVGLLRGRRGALVDGCVFFAAALSGVILGFGDTQQRYSLLIVPSLAIITALSLSSAPAGATASQPAGTQRRAAIATTAWTVAALVFIGLVYVAGSKAARMLALRLPQPLAMTRQDAASTTGAQRCNDGQATLQGDYKRLQITPPAGGGCFSFWSPLPAESRSVSFFLSRDEMPFPFEPRTANPYTVRVLHGNTMLVEADLGLETVRWFRFNLQPVEQGQPNGLRFVVLPKQDTKEPLDVWWLVSKSKPLP